MITYINVRLHLCNYRGSLVGLFGAVRECHGETIEPAVLVRGRGNNLWSISTGCLVLELFDAFSHVEKCYQLPIEFVGSLVSVGNCIVEFPISTCS